MSTIEGFSKKQMKFFQERLGYSDDQMELLQKKGVRGLTEKELNRIYVRAKVGLENINGIIRKAVRNDDDDEGGLRSPQNETREVKEKSILLFQKELNEKYRKAEAEEEKKILMKKAEEIKEQIRKIKKK
jgi:hypothetical protein